MKLGSVEKRRAALVQFLIVLIITFLTLIVIVAWPSDERHLVKALAVLSLLSCLYALAQERKLKKRHDDLLLDVAGKSSKVATLGRELKAEKVELMKLEGRLRELTSLYRAISAVNAVAEHRQTFDAVLRAAIDLVEGDCGSLMLVDEESGRMVFASAVGLDEAIVARSGQRIGEGVAGWVAETGEPLLLTGPIEDEPRFKNIVVREPELNVAMSIPLRLGQTIIGVLNLGSTVEDRKQAFSEDELRFAYIFSQHAAVSIERAQLLAERERLRRMIRG
jgi:transcriptional regulator with GAF, ATPase, and Fis domain